MSVLPPDASQELKLQLMTIYGFDRPYHEQSCAGSGGRCRAISAPRSPRPGRDVRALRALGNTLILATFATFIGFFFGTLFGFVAGYFRNSAIDRIASLISVIGVSVPHYWLGMVLVIIFFRAARLAAQRRERGPAARRTGSGTGRISGM